MENIVNRMALDRETREHVTKDKGTWPVQNYATTKCMNCGSEEQVKISRSERLTQSVRYRRHGCRHCGAKFGSLQQIPQVDQAITNGDKANDDQPVDAAISEGNQDTQGATTKSEASKSPPVTPENGGPEPAAEPNGIAAARAEVDQASASAAAPGKVRKKPAIRGSRKVATKKKAGGRPKNKAASKK